MAKKADIHERQFFLLSDGGELLEVFTGTLLAAELRAQALSKTRGGEQLVVKTKGGMIVWPSFRRGRR